MSIGTIVYKWRWAILAGWLLAAGLLVWLVPSPDPAASERATFLPPDAPHSRAVEAFRRDFPARGGLGEAVVVFERTGTSLTAEDLAAIESVAERIRRPSETAGDRHLIGIGVRSPGSIRLPARENPLISEPSERGQAALIKVNIPAMFVTVRSARIVDHIRGILAGGALPGGLSAAVTGSSGFGRDYALAAEKSHRRTLTVTLAAVVIILLIVYRAPLAAMVPLASISLAAIVAMRLLAAGEPLGLHVGTAEKIFVVVLLYGAGVDYSLLLISRYRENLDAPQPAPPALAGALAVTFLAIAAAAGTDAAGLLMLCFADYGMFRTAGLSVAVALMVALLAAVTLVPAALGIFGKGVFWPGKHLGVIGRQRLWPRVARLVTARPAAVLLVTLIVLGAPAVQGTRLRWVYDTLAALREDYGAARGLNMARRHWPVGEIAPVKILLRADAPLDAAAWQANIARLSRTVKDLPDVRNVRSLSAPLGNRSTAAVDLLVRTFGREQIVAEYVSRDRRATRLEVILAHPALSLEAMAAVEKIRAAVRTAAGQTGIGTEVHLGGATAEIIDIARVARRDFYRVAAMALGVIFLIILVLLRDPILSAFMVASTVLSYLATLGVAYWVFAGLLGQTGLDWKVEIFLFVVMVAVGVDYNIFLAARLAQEAQRLPHRQAARQAVIRTGPVISSCGLIMAATLGSLMAGDLTLLHQLGFALALGMLIDTFLVRPLLLPAFAVLTRRTGRAASLAH